MLDGPPGRGKTAPNLELLDVLRQVCPAALRVRPQVRLLVWGGREAPWMHGRSKRFRKNDVARRGLQSATWPPSVNPMGPT